ncbi:MULTISPECIES: VOC family protein [unclassified Streptomyces]|uniref:VOC family protein n=1 Tax=unclassified Streptomyces TaxID=2593676 RepID=UPI000DB93103|nr:MULTISPECIES: VOC family protein [unclassified Streptomyces]MYT68670.1 VOC family protein [Streptomyces sp. SID8367]RAJ86342.1 putative enzyme related to lactoylglutathione lyase [Streptomyces sp. PsTaAH-137]
MSPDNRLDALGVLGFDNALLPVGDLGEAVAFYERAGFSVKVRFDEAGIALLGAGKETPGLLLRAEEEFGHRSPAWPAARLWLEVRDARAAGKQLTAAGIDLLDPPFSTSTGYVVEFADPWGNVIGFTDYLKRPELART